MDHNHSVPLKILIRAFFTLLALTVLTILAATIDFSVFNKYLPRGMDLGPINVVVALLIAGVKVGVVVGFFMGLKYDKALNKAVVAANIIFVAIFFILTLSDTLYRGMIDPMEGKKDSFDSPVYKIMKKAPGEQKSSGKH